MLRVTVHDTAKTWRLQLEGKLAGEAVIEAERVWMDAPTERAIEVDHGKLRQPEIHCSGRSEIADDGCIAAAAEHRIPIRLRHSVVQVAGV